MKTYEQPKLIIKLLMVEDVIRTSLGDNETSWGWEGLEIDNTFDN